MRESAKAAALCVMLRIRRGLLRLRCGEALHVLRQETLLALHLFVVDGFTVLEGAESVPFDAAEVHEDVFAFRADDEPEPLFRIEPLDVAGRHGRPPNSFGGFDLPNRTEDARSDVSQAAKFLDRREPVALSRLRRV